MAEKGNEGLIVQRIADVHIVEFMQTSILDQVQIEKIKGDLLDLVDRCGHPKIILSFENVRHISSAMLGTLMAVNKKVTSAHGELRLAAIDSQLMEVFRLTRLDKVLKIFKNTEAALVKFAST